MPRLKILISAFFCDPHSGSDAGIGWNIASEMAKKHQVWVVTDTRQKEAIEREFSERPRPNLTVIYHGFSRWLSLGSENLYHHLWQLSVFPLLNRLHTSIRFDLAHHVTPTRYWSPSLLWRLRIPFVWGPVGGGEPIARSALRGTPFRTRWQEWQKAAVLYMAHRDPLVRQTARNSTVAIANTAKTAEKLRRLGGLNIHVMVEAGLDQIALATPGVTAAKRGPIRFVTMTRLLYWKGIDLGLEAFARIEETGSVYWIIGSGPEERYLHRLVHRLGIADRVRFHGNPPREDWLRALRKCDVLVHPCLCNSGSMISLEAMAAGLPVICIETGAISSLVSIETGVRIAPGTRTEIIERLAVAMSRLASNPMLMLKLGETARDYVEKNLSWATKAKDLDQLYRQAIETASQHRAPEDPRDFRPYQNKPVTPNGPGVQ